MDQFASPHDPGDSVSAEDSARKRAEAELRLKQSAIDHSSDPIYWVKADGIIAYANQAACRSLGYRLEELLSMLVSDFDPDFPPETWPAHWKKMKESGTITFESHHRSKEGGVFPVEITTNYLEHDGQEYIWAYVRDITERRRAEEALRESEERYRAVAEDTPVLICRFLPGGEITYVNAAYCKCFEKSAGELVGHSFLSMIPEADHKTVMDAIAALTVDSPTQSLEHQVIAPGGELQWQRWMNRALFDTAGRPVAYQSIGEDITQRKRAEEATQEKEKQLDNLLSNVGVIVMEGDPFDFYYVGGQVERILGYPRELWFEDPGGPTAFWSKHLHPDDTDKIEICRRAIELGENYAFEYRMIAADGREVWFYDTVTVETENGVPVKTRAVMVDITERKRAENALSEREEEMRAIIETSRDWIWAIDLQGRHIYSNPAVEVILGIRPEEVVGKSSFSLMHEEDRKMVEAMLPEWIEQEKGWSNLLIRWRHKDGSWRYLESNAVPLLDAQGRMAGFRGVDRDVTERKRVEEALRRSEERLDLAVRGTSDGLWDADLVTGEEYWSPRFRELLGYAEDEIEATHDRFLALLHPEDKAEVVEAVRLHLEENQPYDCEFRMQTKSGQYRWFQSRGEALRDRNGKPYRMTGSIRDITDRRRTKKALQESEERLRLMMQQSPSAIEVYDVDGLQVDVNKAYESLWGFPADHTVSRFNVLESQQVEATGLMEYVKRAYAGEAVEVPEYEFDSRGATEGRGIGRIRWLNTRIYPLKDSEGTVHHIVITHEDITERKRAEKQRLELEGQLRQAQKMEAVGQLAAGVAHDFNNLLTVILCNSEMLLSALAEKSVVPSDELLRSGLELIQTAGKQAASLTRQLLTFGRRETAKPEVLDPKKVVGDMEEMLHRLIGKHIQLDLRLKEGTWFILAVPGQIEQVVMNLVLNAADATSKGGRVEIRVENVELDEMSPAGHAGAKPGRHVLLSVADTGTGMTPDTLEHMFEPFFTTKPVGKGTGLGLATVYGVAKQLGGHIRVDSKLGVGSTLRIYVPVAEKKQAKRGDENRSDSFGRGGHPVPRKPGSGARSPLPDAP